MTSASRPGVVVRDPAITVAPAPASASATASPMPLLAPVTTAVLPWSSVLIQLSSFDYFDR
ncbi:hypothetical protein HEP87_62190 [Streptomyces sp. S1D4-11]